MCNEFYKLVGFIRKQLLALCCDKKIMKTLKHMYFSTRITKYDTLKEMYINLEMKPFDRHQKKTSDLYIVLAHWNNSLRVHMSWVGVWKTRLKCRSDLKVLFFYFNMCLSVMWDNIFCSFTFTSFLLIFNVDNGM
jgi:hypothetical protein